MAQQNQSHNGNNTNQATHNILHFISSYQEAYNSYPDILRNSIIQGEITPQQANFIDEIICVLYSDGPQAHTVNNYRNSLIDLADDNEDINIPDTILTNITRLFTPLLTENIPIALLEGGDPTPNDYTLGFGAFS